MDKLEAMTIFVAVVQERGLSAAARKLGIAAPAVTRAVNELESIMKVRLLVRSTRVVTVTDVGLQYAIDCRRVLDEINDVEQSAAGTHLAVKGKLVVSASVMYGRLRLNQVVLEYLRRYPDAEVECRYLDRYVNMLNEGVDIAIRIGDLPDSSYHATPLAHVRRIVCAAPAYLAENGTPLHPRDLESHSIVSALGIERGHSWRFHDKSGSFDVPLKPRLATTSNDHALLAAQEGFGLTRVLSYMADNQLRSGGLVEVLGDYSPPAAPVQALQRQGSLASRKVRAFIDLAIEHLRQT